LSLGSQAHFSSADSYVHVGKYAAPACPPTI
jgi:hypothetical protein